MTNVFDITDFGAVGDGLTDNTAAIQTALDEAGKVGGAVIVPPGKYRTGKLTVSGDGVTIQGYAAWYFKDDGGSILLLNHADKDTDCLLDISKAFGVSVKDLCINGRDLGCSIHGVKSQWPVYNGSGKENTPTIDNCRISHFSGNGVHFEHIWCFSIRHSMLSFNSGAGLYIDGWDAFIIDNWFSGNMGGGILGGPTVASITCTGNRVEWNRKGGFILPYGDSYNITGNFFDRSFGPALILGAEKKDSVRLVTVTGNIFRRSGAKRNPLERFSSQDMSCHMHMKNCSNVVVTGNSMKIGRDDNNAGVVSPDYSFIIEDCTECIVKDNVMDYGAIKENMVLRGDLESCVIEGNIGRAGNTYQ